MTNFVSAHLFDNVIRDRRKCLKLFVVQRRDRPAVRQVLDV